MTLLVGLFSTAIAAQDKGGRTYPFLIYRRVENPVSHEFHTIIPLLYKDFYLASDELCNADWTNKGLNDLYTEVDQLKSYSVNITRRNALETTIDALNANTLENRFFLGYIYRQIMYLFYHNTGGIK